MSEKKFPLVPGVRWKRNIGSYDITWNGSVIFCTCPAFKFQRRPVRDRTCKHIQAYFPDHQNLPDLYPVQKVAKPDFFLLAELNPERPPKDIESFLWSVKLDGVRVLYDKKQLVTRGGMTVRAPKELLRGLPKNLALDCELYAGKNTLNKVIAAMQVGPPDPFWNHIQVMVFDTPEYPDEPFLERYQRLLEHREDHPKEVWKLVPQHRVRSFESLSERLDQLTEAGEEGIVLRHKDALYQPGRNSKMALKWKRIEHAQGVLVAPHKTKEGTWVVEGLEGRRFMLYVHEHDREGLKSGRKIVFSLRGLTKDGDPKFPQFERVE